MKYQGFCNEQTHAVCTYLSNSESAYVAAMKLIRSGLPGVPGALHFLVEGRKSECMCIMPWTYIDGLSGVNWKEVVQFMKDGDVRHV